MPTSISRYELVPLLAMLFATIAFSLDAMLPALPDIGQELSPDNLNKAQLVLTSFILGMGVGTLFTGPLSDSFGRKPVMLGGAFLYVIGSAAAYFAESLELMLIARVLQGLGAAGPRVVALAVVRDLFSGSAMARIMSFVMLVFTMVPAIAPSLGLVIITATSWRGLFVAFILFASIACAWVGLRLPETLKRENRRPFQLATISSALRELLSNRVVTLAICAQTISYAMIFAMISSVQQIYEVIFDKASSFPLWFGAVAILSSTASILNATLVVRLGMRFIVTTMFVVQFVVAGLMALIAFSGVDGTTLFVCFLFWKVSIFFNAGLTIGNLNAVAMEPVGHIAGAAASVIGSLSTVGAVLLAVPIGLMFNGTLIPITLSYCLMGLAGALVMRSLRQYEQKMA